MHVVIVFTFPGQGSQRPGMGVPWQESPSWDVVGRIAEACDRDVAHLLLEADAAELQATRNSQLATFSLSLVIHDAVTRSGVAPTLAAGHSLGEYTALVAAGALELDDAARLVCERGEAMQAAADAQPATMVAVMGLDDDLVELACTRSGEEAWVANRNAPGQVVVAGTIAGVERAAEQARELGARKVLPLPVGGAFHTPLMASARERLDTALATCSLQACAVPVVSNVDARPHQSVESWVALLSAQLTSPVRWRECLHTLAALGGEAFVELGPGRVLAGMASRTLPGARTVSVAVPDDLEKLGATLAAPGGPEPPADPSEGEHLHALERLVVSPTAGVFQADPVRPGDHLSVGDVLGRVGDRLVQSAFAGRIGGVLAFDGERVTARQPIAWLRT